MLLPQYQYRYPGSILKMTILPEDRLKRNLQLLEALSTVHLLVYHHKPQALLHQLMEIGRAHV